MTLQWKTFRGGEIKRNSAGKTTMSVSINSKYIIKLNRAALISLGEPIAVLLHYDDRENVIGVEAASPAT